MPALRRTCLALFALLCTVPALATAATAPDFKWGLVAYHVNKAGYRLLPSDLQRMADNGIEWIRVDFAWGQIEPLQDEPFDWSYFDMIVEEAGALGIKVAGTLGNGYNTEQRPVAPLWTQDMSNDVYVVQLNEYARATVARYADGVDAWALENEVHLALPHAAVRWRTLQFLDVEFQDAILATLSDVVRANDPSAEIVLTASAGFNVEAFMQRVGSRIDFDSIGLYTYLSPLFTVDAAQIAAKLAEQMQLVADAAGGDRPVMIFETGYHTSRPRRTEALQVDYVEALSVAARQAGASGLFLYQYLDNADERAEADQTFGLLRENRTAKPAWARYGQMIRNDGAAAD
jgi:hypothetical protein